MLNEKPKLALDLDGNIVYWEKTFVSYVEETIGAPMPKPINPLGWEYNDAYGPAPGNKTWDALVFDFLEEESVVRMELMQDAKDVMARWAVRNALHIVTARPAVHHAVTEELIRVNGLDGIIEELHMPTADGEHAADFRKGPYCAKLGAFALSDDATHNINSVIEHGLRGILNVEDDEAVVRGLRPEAKVVRSWLQQEKVVNSINDYQEDGRGF